MSIFGRLFAAAAAVALLASPVLAQGGGTITGRVTDAATGRPVAGAQVVVGGTVRNAMTNPEGRYTIEGVPAGTHVVSATRLGYGEGKQSVTVAAGGSAIADFALATSVVALEGVVVTGTGTSTEVRKLTAPVNVLDGEEIAEAPVSNVGTLLQGRVPGASVQAVSGQPGTAPLIRFRGVNSVVGSTTPVIYVDGVRVDNSMGSGIGTGGEQTSALADLLSSDIERIEITKGGAASTLYGSDAAAGVIQIFTKRGSAGSPRITARIEQGLDQAETKFLQDVGFAFPESSYPQLYQGGNFNPDFFKENFHKDGYFQNYSVGVSGGTESATYNVSGRAQNNTGIQPKNGSTLYALRGGLQAFLGDKAKVDFSGAYTRNQFARLYNGTAYEDPRTAFEVGDALNLTGASTLEEALDIYLMPDINEEVNRFTFGTTTTYTPSALFNSRLTFGIDFRSNEQRLINPIDFPIDDPDAGSIDRYNRNYSAVTLDYAGTLSWPRDGDITSEFTFGAQGFREDESTVRASGTNFALPGTDDFDAAANIVARELNTEIFNGGFYFLERLGFFDRLFLEGGLRLDGNSSFGENVGLQAYPKVGAAYTLSDEPFFQNLLGAYVNAVKLRAAYGETGKFPQAFLRDRTFSAVPFRGESAPRFDNPGNLDLRPEVTATTEAGVDLALLENRVGVTFTWYDARTEDALFFVAEQPATGLGTQLRNVGEIRNTGIELGTTLGLIRSRNVDWELTATYNTVENEVLSLGGVAPFAIGNGGRVDAGKPVGAYFVNTPIDTNDDGKLDAFDRQYVGGQPYPTRSGSVITDVTLFGNLSLNGLMEWARGATVVDYGAAWASFNALDRVTFPTRHDLQGNELRKYTYTQAFSSLLMRGDYWKLRELGVRYSLPQAVGRRIGSERAVLYLTGRNLYTGVPRKQCLFAVDCRDYLVDPELSGVDSSGELQLGGATSITAPAPREFRLGIEVSFQ